jgi:ABC-2 type transport system permease protein
MTTKIMTRLKTFLKYNSLLKELVVRDIKIRYRRSVLGLLWTVLNPLMMMIILSIVFSSLFRMNIVNFPVYVLIGNVIFNFNADSTSQALMSIVANSSLIKKVYIPKYLFPLSKVLSCLVNLGFSFISLLIVMLFTKAPFYITLVTIWIPIIYLLMFSLGLGLILSAVEVYFRDIAHLYGVIITAWMYLTPLFYSIDIVPDTIKKLIVLNPMYHYVTFFRKIIMDGVFPSLSENLICFSCGVVMILVGMFAFDKLQDRFILHI